MNVEPTISNKQDLLDAMRAVVSKIRALAVVITDVDLDVHHPEVIDNYLDVIIDLSQQAEHCCSQLRESTI